MNRLLEVRLTLDTTTGKIKVDVLKEFAPEYGGGTQIFTEDGGLSWHFALEIARRMITVSPSQRTNAG